MYLMLDYAFTKPFFRNQEFQLNNNHRNESKAVSESKKVSLAGLRIDERGGIYLNPLLDSNTSYFKWVYVCAIVHDQHNIHL